MKLRILAVLLFAAAAFAAVSVVTPTNTARGTEKSARAGAPLPPAKTLQRRPDPPGTVDGARNPEMIPDHVAYLMFFRLISNRQTEEEQHRVRAYFKQLGVGLGAEKCPQCKQRGLEKVDADKLLEAADEFQRRVVEIDRIGQELKDRHHPDHPSLTAQEKEQVKRANAQRAQLVAELVSALSRRLSADGWAKLQYHINRNVRRNVKIYNT